MPILLGLMEQSFELTPGFSYMNMPWGRVYTHYTCTSIQLYTHYTIHMYQYTAVYTLHNTYVRV